MRRMLERHLTQVVSLKESNFDLGYKCFFGRPLLHLILGNSPGFGLCLQLCRIICYVNHFRWKQWFWVVRFSKLHGQRIEGVHECGSILS
jgi:hypothetical protein